MDIECSDPNLRICGIMNRDKSVTVGVVNRNKEATEISLDSHLFGKAIRVYEYEASKPPYNDFADLQDYTEVVDPENPTYTLKPESVTYFTTDYLVKEKRIEADGVMLTENELRWNAVSDKHHCYYRVFSSDREDFVPSAENQIASTVATSLKTDKAKQYIKVLSVDKSGNM